MRVRDAMSPIVVSISPEQSIREAAALMTRHQVGSGVVVDESLPVPGIITERDILRAIADGDDPSATLVRDRMTFDASSASDSWDIDRAAETMVERGFRHLLVVDGDGQLCGIVSMRDIVSAMVRGGTRPPA